MSKTTDRKAYCEMSLDELTEEYHNCLSAVNNCVITCEECDDRRSDGCYSKECENMVKMCQFRCESDIIEDLLYSFY